MHSFHAAVDCTTGQSVFKPKNWNNLKQTIVIDLKVKYFLSHLDAVNDKRCILSGAVSLILKHTISEPAEGTLLIFTGKL